MKKLLTTTVLTLSALVLTACSSQEAWLNGSWKSEKAKTAYEFKEEKGKWTIQQGKEKIAEKAEVKDKKGDKFNLVDSNGNRFEIEKEDENTIKYQPFSTDGMSATNGESIELKKEK